MPNAKRILPAWAWDRLKAVADAVGGVGKGSVGIYPKFDADPCPLCLDGIAIACDYPERNVFEAHFDDMRIGGDRRGPVQSLLIRYFGGYRSGVWAENDSAVADLLEKADDPFHYTANRVPFEQLMARLGFVRGEEVTNA